MAGVKIAAAASGGSAEIAGPPSSSANTVLKLPADTGSAGQFLTVKSANHSATNAELEFGHTVKKIKLDGTTNSSKAAGDFWYQSSDGKFYLAGGASGVWSAGGNNLVARYLLTACGVLNAGLSISGYTHLSWKTTCETYNGTSWSAIATCSTGVYDPGSTGTTAAALKCGGYSGSYVKTTEEYNGSAWSSANEPSATVGMGAECFGTQTAGAVVGGRSGGSTYLDSTEEYDGTNWSSGGDISEEKAWAGAAGTQTAGLQVGGYNTSGANSTVCQEYDGTSWSTGGSPSAGRTGMSIAGVQTSVVLSGGHITGSTYVQTTELYDGTSWSSGPTRVYAIGDGEGGGSGASAFTTCGFQGGGAPIALTEEYDVSLDQMLSVEGV